MLRHSPFLYCSSIGPVISQDGKLWRRRRVTSRLFICGERKDTVFGVSSLFGLQFRLTVSELLSRRSGNLPPRTNAVQKAGRSAPAMIIYGESRVRMISPKGQEQPEDQFGYARAK